jgi:hypothetical protein
MEAAKDRKEMQFAMPDNVGANIVNTGLHRYQNPRCTIIEHFCIIEMHHRNASFDKRLKNQKALFLWINAASKDTKQVGTPNEGRKHCLLSSMLKQKRKS